MDPTIGIILGLAVALISAFQLGRASKDASNMDEAIRKGRGDGNTGR